MVQIILYVGGIMVLFVFVIMLVNLDVSVRQMKFSNRWVAGFLALVLGGLLFMVFRMGGSLLIWRSCRGDAAAECGASGQVLFQKLLAAV